jgi:hypothetical protein
MCKSALSAVEKGNLLTADENGLTRINADNV